ncbi:MAG: ribonuclease R [bacterium]
MKKNILQKVLGLLATEPNRTFKPKEMARKLGVSKSDYAQFRDLIKAAARQGKIAKYRGNNFGTITRATTLEGELHVKTQGYGFLITKEGEEDVFISQKNMGTALHKDTVRVQLYAQSTGRSREGRVVAIVQRARQNIVGTYQKTRNYGFVTPDNLKITRDIFITPGEDKKAKSGQKVVAQVTYWQDERSSPEGKIVEVLGFPDEPGVDVMSVVKSFDLPTKFPKQVEQEATAIPEAIPKDEIKRRLDLRKQICFTIDPEDAKDFDDAVSIKKRRFGNYELGVHIADVSYYVRPGTKLDREARNRGTSVYLVDQVVPMLPEKLSNEICSLRARKDRLTFSCIMEVTPKGEVVRYEIAQSVINSKHRFTYEEVQAIIEADKSRAKFAHEIKLMQTLSQALMKRRERLGSLDFNLPEVKVDLDADGNPVAIKKRERLDSHRLVEEFMLLANQTVTRHVALELAQNGRLPAFIYRIHEQPDEAKMDDFRKFVRALGYPLDPNKEVTAQVLGQHLKRLAGKPEEVIVQELMLRSMMKAKYSTDNVGHFGLAFKHYTHFTSPIRRYPDLIVHRLLREYKNGVNFEEVKKKKASLEKIAEKALERELVALEAERESIKLKKVEYMQRHLGDEFEAVISGVVAFGIFVEITDLLVEGLVHISDLEDDYFFHDEQNYQLVGQKTGRSYRLGDPVKVRVVRVSVDERVIDFVLV